MLVRLEHHPSGPRLWIGRRRVHHWHGGTALLALGAWLIYGDRQDLFHRQVVVGFDPEVGITTSQPDGW